MQADSLPLITVFVPWIGREAYIQQAIESLLRQDYPRLEILISDNSLSHSARSVIGALEDPRIRLIERSERRLSAAAHYEACLRDARGEYVMILSDDDVAEPRYISSMYEAMTSRPGVTVCIGEQIAIGKNDDVRPPPSSGVHFEIYHGPAFVVRRLLNSRSMPIITYMSLFARRADMLRYPYRDYPDGSHSDNYMFIALALDGQVAVSSAKLYYRIYESSGGLSTPFGFLLIACSRYKRDMAQLLRRHRQELGIATASVIRILIHAKTSALMGRRLLGMYRKRMRPARFAASLVQLAFYACGISPLGKAPPTACK
jgi:glycosyltransferase involved in cell wall biosynthesis